MLSASNIPPIWAWALSEIQRSCPLAFIGGGALRDLDNGAPVKDLDIFVEAGSDLAEMRLDLFPVWTKEKAHLDVAAYGNIGLGVTETVELVSFANAQVPLNIIAVDEGTCTFEKQAARFDFGICQIAFDGREVRFTDAYAADKVTQTFTLFAREGDREERSLRRWDRLSPKYPGWRLVR